MSAYYDCSACACLVRAQDAACPFCGARLRTASAPSLKLGLVLTLGLGLVTIACGEEDDKDTVADSVTESATVTDSNATIGNDSQNADAVTYAGPDETTSIGEGSTSFQGTTDYGTSSSTGSSSSSDSQEADAVTYAGPDESTSIGTSG